MKDTRKQPRPLTSSADVILTDDRGVNGLATSLHPRRRCYEIAGDRTAESLGGYGLDSLYEFNPIAQVVLDKGGVIRVLNRAAARLLGQNALHVIGRSLHRQLKPDDREPFQHHVREVFTRPGSIVTCELRLLHPDEKITDIELKSVAAVVEGEMVSITAMMDISQLKQGACETCRDEMVFAHAGRLNTLGEMAAGIAHEVNQPLSVVLTYAQIAQRMLKSDGGNTEEFADLLQRIVVQAEYAGAIIQRIRSFARNEKPQRTVLNVNAIVNEAIAFVDPEVRRNGISLTTALGDNLPPVYVDQLQIEQVLVNLLCNAMEALATSNCHPRHVRVETARSSVGNALEVIVWDSGPGVKEENIEKIFEPFFTTNPNGMGLGLSLSRSIVESHGGRLWYKTDNGLGSAFHVLLPTVEGDRNVRPGANSLRHRR